jgi:hypothetical protein
MTARDYQSEEHHVLKPITEDKVGCAQLTTAVRASRRWIRPKCNDDAVLRRGLAYHFECCRGVKRASRFKWADTHNVALRCVYVNECQRDVRIAAQHFGNHELVRE